MNVYNMQRQEVSMGRKALFESSDQIDQDLKKLYAQGYSLCSIAKGYNTYPQVIKRHLIRLGVPLRNISEAMSSFHKIRKETNATNQS